MSAVVIYWSSTGNTEAIASKIASALGVEAKSVSDISVSDALGYDTLVLGCPAMGAEELEDSEFRPFFEEVAKDTTKKYAFFGSYGWGGGEWMQNWLAEAKEKGLNVVANLISSGGVDEIEGDFDSFIQAINA